MSINELDAARANIDWRDIIPERKNPYRPGSVDEVAFNQKVRGWAPLHSRLKPKEETTMRLHYIAGKLERIGIELDNEDLQDAAWVLRAKALDLLSSSG